MRFSYAMLADYPLVESLSSIKKADELGFYAVYAADETWHKDLWLLFAAAAAQTSQIRMGPSVSGVVLREPTLIAQAAATLDELTGGRAEVAVSSASLTLPPRSSVTRLNWYANKPATTRTPRPPKIRAPAPPGTTAPTTMMMASGMRAISNDGLCDVVV